MLSKAHHSSLRCLECDNYARWHVWYKDCSSPTGPLLYVPFNIAYNSFCDEHAIEEMKNGRKGWAVVCVKLVGDQFLPSEDRAFAKVGVEEAHAK